MEEIGSLSGNPELLADGVKERSAGIEQNIEGGGRDEAREDLAREELALENWRADLAREGKTS